MTGLSITGKTEKKRGGCSKYVCPATPKERIQGPPSERVAKLPYLREKGPSGIPLAAKGERRRG